MITGVLLKMGYALVAFFLGLLPVLSLPDGVVDAIQLIWTYLNMFSFLFPMGALVGALTLTLTFHGILLGYDLTMKIYHMIRG